MSGARVSLPFAGILARVGAQIASCMVKRYESVYDRERTGTGRNRPDYSEARCPDRPRAQALLCFVSGRVGSPLEAAGVGVLVMIWGR